MKRHVVTAVLLLAAVVLYLAGLSGAGVAVMFAGAAFEAWFWVRVLTRRPSRQALAGRREF